MTDWADQVVDKHYGSKPVVLDAIRKQKQFESSLDYGVTQNPDASAKDQANAKQLGLPLGTVERKQSEVDQIIQKQNLKKKLDKTDFAKKFFSDPNNAAIAHDDADQLIGIETAIKAGNKLVEVQQAAGVGITQATLGISESIWRTPQAVGRVLDGLNKMLGIKAASDWVVKQGWDPFARQSDTGAWQIAIEELFHSGEIADRIGDAQDILNKTFAPFQRMTEKGRQADIAFEKAFEGDFVPLTDIITDPEAWAGFIGQAAPSLYMAYKSGGSIPFIAWLESMETANSAAEFEEQTGDKVDPVLFTQAAAQVALINSYLERLGLEKIFGNIGRGTLASFMKGALFEGGTEGLQEFNQNMAAILSFDPSRDPYQGVLPGIMGGTGAGGPSGAFSAMGKASGPNSEFAGDISRSQSALDARDQLNELVNAVADSKLKERDKEKFRSYLEDQLGVENAVYMAPEDAQAFFQSHPEVIEALPESTRESVTEALTMNADVAIPKADYLTYFTDFHAEIEDILRNDIDGMNAREAEAWMETGTQEFETAAERILTEMDLESEFAQSAAKVQADVEANLIAVGQAPENARKVAQLQKSFAVVAAQKMNTTPEEIVKRFPVMFQSQPLQDVEGLTQEGGLSGLSEDALISVAEYGDLGATPLNVFHRPEDQKVLRDAGLVRAAISETGQKYEEVVAGPLFEERDRRGREVRLAQGLTQLEQSAVDAHWENWTPETTKEGAIKGAAEWIKNAEDLKKLENLLHQLTQEGLEGRYWYEESARRILELTRGDFVEAERLIQVIAIYSPQTSVQVNTGFAIRAWTQWKEGWPINVKTADQDAKATDVFNGKNYEGRKTNSFYQNLMYEIVNKYPESMQVLKLDQDLVNTFHKPATIDVWMLRAFGYLNDSASNDKGTGKYSFAENYLRKITAQLNKDNEGDPWTPHQVQAAIWTAMKARYELHDVKQATNEESVAKGYSVKVGKNKYERKSGVENKRKHLQIWRKHAMAVSSSRATRAATEQAASFETFIDQMTRVVTWEAKPSEKLGLEIFDASPEVIQQFTRDAANLILTEEGEDTLATLLGVPLNYVAFSEGAYGGAVTPNALSHLLPPKDPGAFGVKEAQTYARAIQYIFKQDAVPWFRPEPLALSKAAQEKQRFRVVNLTTGKTVPKSKLAPDGGVFDNLKDAQKLAAKRGDGFGVRGGEFAHGVSLLFDHALTVADEQAVLDLLGEGGGFTKIASDEIAIVNFRDDETHVPFVDDDVFAQNLAAIADDLMAIGLTDASEFMSQGEYGYEHDWTQDPIGQAILDQKGIANRPDIQEWVQYRREEFDTLLEDYSGENLKRRETEVANQGVLHQGPVQIASIEDVDPANVVSPIDFTASQEEKAQQLHELGLENEKIIKPILQAIDKRFGTKSGVNHKELHKIVEKANRPSIKFRKPWHDVEHIRDGFRFKTVLDDYSQLPEIIGMLANGGISIVKADTPKLLDPGPFGWRIVAFDLLMPNGQIVEWYLPINELEKAKKSEGHAIFEKWRNLDESQMTEEQYDQYLTDRMHSFELYSAAFDEFLRRTGQEESALRASLSSAEALASSETNLKSLSSSPSVNGTLVQEPSTRMAESPGAMTATVSSSLASNARTGIGFTSTESIPQSAEAFRYLQTNRGQIQFTDQGAMITLLENADLSTALHELGHYFFESYKTLAEESPEIRADMDTLLEFIGVPDLNTWNNMTLDQRRAGHEKVAEAFEKYLFEGKAPSLELQSLFETFKSWLKQVYQNLLRGRPLTDEVREVFDRMLASEEQIRSREVANGYQAIFGSQEESGMTASQWEQYQNLNEMQQKAARSSLERRSLKDMQWLDNARSRLLKEMQAEHKAKRRDMRAEVADEVAREPVYYAMHFLRTGETVDFEGNPVKIEAHQLDRQEFKENYPNFKLPRGMTATDGVPADVLAEQLGWSSGDEMIQAILRSEPQKERVDRLTDQRMLATYGDLGNPEKMQEAVEEAIHGEAHTRFLHTELSHLIKQTGVGNVLNRAAKAFAETAINRKKVRDVKPYQYSQAESRAARNSQRAMMQGDRESAAEHKRAQVLNNHFFKAANKAKKDIEKALRYFKKFNRDGTRKNLDPDYRDQIDSMLEKYEFRQASLKTIDKRKSLKEWIDQQQELGFDPIIDDRLMAETKRQHYKDTPVEELMALYDSVKNIEHLARLKHKLLKQKEARILEEVATETGASIRNFGTGKNKVKIEHNSWMDRAKKGFNEYFAMHRKFSSMARQMDGDKVGPMFEYFIRPMNESGDMEAVEREKATMVLHEIFEPLMKLKLREKTYIREIDTSLSREGRIMIALNWGNEINRRRVMDGDGWTEEQVQAILDTLTETEWDFVQSTWDFIDSYWPKIADKERRVSGVVPQKVQALPVQTDFGEYAGGYFPIMYDPERSTRSEQLNEAEIAKQAMMGTFTRSTTRRGHTKERFEGQINRPVRKDFGSIFQHVDQVIHDLSWHEWLIDTNRLLSQSQVDSAIRETYGPEVLKTFRNHVKDIAAGDIPAQNRFEAAVNHIRTGATIAGMGWSLWTSLLQPLGLTQSFVRVGPKYMGRGLSQFLGSAVKMESTGKKIFEKSDFMRLRGKTLQREINEIRNKVSDGGKLPLAQDSFFYLIMKLQQVADFPTWLGQYEKAVDQGFDEASAVAQADQAVIDAQGGGQVKDLAQIQRGSPLLKLWTNFYSYFNVTMNLTAESAARLKRTKNVGRFAVDMMMLYTVPATLSALMREALRGDCSDEACVAEKVVQENLSYMAGTLVGVREMSGMLAGYYGYSGPPGTRFFSEFSKFGQQALQGEADAAFWRAANQSAGILFHYPAAQVQRTVEGTIAVIEGDVEGWEAVKAPMFGPPR